jgi:hypothetical protein
MDDLTRAVYRGFCLLATAMHAPRDMNHMDLVELTNRLFDELVPPAEQDIDFDIPPMDAETEKAFLADVRDRAARNKEYRDQEKLERAVAMADEENIERGYEGEEQLGTR